MYIQKISSISVLRCLGNQDWRFSDILWEEVSIGKRTEDKNGSGGVLISRATGLSSVFVTR